MEEEIGWYSGAEMSDIVERLRVVQRLHGDTFSSKEIIGMVGQAADEIDRLRAALADIASGTCSATGAAGIASDALAGKTQNEWS